MVIAELDLPVQEEGINKNFIIKTHMKIETLKELIETEYDRCETISQFKSEVFRLLEMYNRDMLNNVVLPIRQTPDELVILNQLDRASK